MTKPNLAWITECLTDHIYNDRLNDTTAQPWYSAEYVPTRTDVENYCREQMDGYIRPELGELLDYLTREESDTVIDDSVYFLADIWGDARREARED